MSESPKTPRKVRIGLLPHQFEGLEDTDSKIQALVGGLGSGKSFYMACKGLSLGFANAPYPGLVVEPTYRLVEDVAIRTFRELLDDREIPYHLHKTHHILTVAPGSPNQFEIFFRSGDDPNGLIGVNAAWGILDEFGQVSEETAKAILKRTRHPKAKFRQRVFVGTPEGLGWGYTWFVENPSEGTNLIKATTMANHHLDPEYVEILTAHMDAEEIAQYLRGEFIERGGRVYSLFTDAKNVRPCDDPLQGRIEIWADFNVSPMVWAFVSIRQEKIKGRNVEVAHVFGELVRNSTNTRTQAREAKLLLQKIYHQDDDDLTLREIAERTTLICDAAGRQHHTSSATLSGVSETDISVLQEEGFQVETFRANPPVKDRVWSVNYKSSDGELLVDKEGARYIYDCLLRQVIDKKREAPDKKAGFDHGADAVGYGVYYHWPKAAPGGNSFSYH